MSRQILVDEEHIKEERPIAQKLIANKGVFNTFQIVDRGKYGTTELNLQLLEIIEKSLSVCMETAKQFTNLMNADRGQGFHLHTGGNQQELFFIYLFSLFAASAEGDENCSALIDTKLEINDTFKVDEIIGFINKTIAKSIVESSTMDFLGALSGELLKDYLDYIIFFRDHPNPAKKINSSAKLLERSIVYFKTLKNTLTDIAADSQYAPFREVLEKSKVNVLNKSFCGFSYSLSKSQESSQLVKVGIDEIIGNEDYIKAALRLARDVAGFDFDTWENPKQINPILFAMGSPGCGKTITAHAIGNYFINFCNEREIPAKFVVIRRTDWASSYQNASAVQLVDIFKKNIIDYKGVVGIYWPDIDTAFAARTDSQVRNEEKNILGTVFGLFDGTILPKNGQWFMMCDANYLNMDKATISRITQDPYYVKGPITIDNFVKLFRDVKLSNHRQFLSLSDEQWHQFGDTCVKAGLSGRSIENMSRKAISVIEDFDFPDEYYQADIKGKREIIKKCSNILTYEDIDKILLNYITFEKEAEEKAARKRFEDRVEEISTYVNAKKHVLSSLEIMN